MNKRYCASCGRELEVQKKGIILCPKCLKLINELDYARTNEEIRLADKHLQEWLDSNEGRTDSPDNDTV